MPVPKSEASNLVKSNDGNGSIDTLIQHTIGKEPYLTFSRANESSIQLNQMLNAWNQPAYLSGWPLHLLPPVKIQMQKCDKCSREFCSTISYRRHLRLHRRKLNTDKDSATKIRSLLQAFWDKLSEEEAKEIMSLDDVSLEEISGSAIIKALTSAIRKPGYTSLPQSFMKSGSVLLDIVQGRSLSFPISSQELFKILDDASENTFLCAGRADSLQKFVFNGDAGKIGLELRNLVACTSFLVEQKLVKACLADKDAEALRYQKLLMVEEEAAQNRQAALMEKKRLKKLRQKEQMEKELEIPENYDAPTENSPSPPSSTLTDDDDSTLEMLEITPDVTPTLEHSQLVKVEGHIIEDQENMHPDITAHEKAYPDLGAYQKFEHRRLHRNSHRQVINTRWLAPKSHKGFNTSQKRVSLRKSNSATNGTKVWTVKPKSEFDEESYKPRIPLEEAKLPCQERKFLIGSIPVSLGNHTIPRQTGNFRGNSGTRTFELSVLGENGACERPVRGDENQSASHHHDNGGNLLINNSKGVSDVGNTLCNDTDVVLSTSIIESVSNSCNEKSDTCMLGGNQGGLNFSSHLAEAFLSQRWREAITAEHVELVLSAEGSPHISAARGDHNKVIILSPELDGRSVLRNTENCSPVDMGIQSSATVTIKAKAKPKKHSKVKYIQKQINGL